MLCAQTKEGSTVCLPPYTRTEIKELRKTNEFYCPTCKEKLIIKVGTEITPHFSHGSVSTCSGGGEGEIHEKGKWLLYKWLKRQFIDVKLEVYIQEIKQRPDIFFTQHSKKYAVEFQHSTVSISEIRKRNKTYQSIGITPIWFLDSKHLRQQSANRFKLNSFMKQFLFQPSNQQLPIILFFCTEKEQIISLQNIIFISLTKIFGQKYVHPLQSSDWYAIFNNCPIARKSYLKKWVIEKKNFRMQHRMAVGKQKEWLLWLYERQLTIDYLPSMIHLPVKGQMFMNVQPWNWQSRLWYYLQYEIRANQQFTLQDCLHNLSIFTYSQEYFPLLKHTQSPVISYIEWLCLLGYVKQVDTLTYTLYQSIPPLSHIEEAMKQDTILMKRIQQLYRHKEKISAANR